MKENKSRYRRGIYQGIRCDSSWELAFVAYCVDHGIKIERYKGFRKYIFNGVEYRYNPDFVINDDTIIEIKGHKDKVWTAKLEANPDVKVFYKKEMQKYLNYTKEKYGENFCKVLFETKWYDPNVDDIAPKYI